MTPALEAIMKRYKVKLRNEPQTVHHVAYDLDTVVEPEDFMIYEAAIKSIYRQTMIGLKLDQKWKEFMGCISYYGEMCDPNHITLPWIKDSEGEPEYDQAAKDRSLLVEELCNRRGVNARTGEEVGLYYALLD